MQQALREQLDFLREKAQPLLSADDRKTLSEEVSAIEAKTLS